MDFRMEHGFIAEQYGNDLERMLMVRYGELGLKGKNKSQFIDRLVKNIQYALRDVTSKPVTSTWGRIMIPCDWNVNEIVDQLQRVFGIYSMSPVVKVEKDMEIIKETAWQILQEAMPKGGTFKVNARRSDKKFPVLSPDITQQVAAYIFDHCDESFRADMHNPENMLNIEVREEGAYIYSEVIEGAKGMPLGTGGKAILMLSGGIDSPVAGFMTMKRGVVVEAVHFHSFPFTSERAKEKVVDLCRALSRYANAPIKLHVVHFTEIQKAIHEKCSAEYGITIMRRFMFRIAEKIAKQQNALAIVTGESVGQVASQTLESMNAINDVVQMPVLRPVVCFDKEEIMQRAEKIGTYDISIRPYEDCCTIFLPPHPKIRPSLKESRRLEERLAVEELIEEALAKTEVLKISI